ncbi:MAG: transporter suffix domain-containing protein [Acidiferrobacterales bacterium]
MSEPQTARQHEAVLFVKDWKYYLGLTLFIFSWCTFGFAFLVPLLGLSMATAAAVATALIISGEVTFWASVALLGKPLVQAFKAKMIAFLRRRATVELRPVSKRRHYWGLALFFSSFLAFYLVAAVPFLELSRQQTLAVIIVILVTGEAMFFASLFVLGGEFWAKLKNLFQWTGEVPTS